MLFDILIEPNIWISEVLNFIFNNYYVEWGERDKLNLHFFLSASKLS